MHIELDTKIMRHYVPGRVFQQGAFHLAFRDLPNCDAATQADLVHGIVPHSPYIACVGDTYADARHGLYFASWLLQRLVVRTKSETPLFVLCDDSKPDELTGVVPAPERRREDTPCGVVVSFGTTITDAQAERARDVIARFEVPIILQCAGMSPLTIAQRLFKPCHFPFYLTGARTHIV